MEGRARARPNRHPDTAGHARPHTFNGGPGTCPAKRVELDHYTVDALLPSMEGRARARPNRSLDLVPLKCLFAGVCERWRKRELRRYVDCVVKLRFALCHKASSGPLELCAHRSARIR